MANTPATSFRLPERALSALDELVKLTSDRDRALWEDAPASIRGDYTRSEVLTFTILRNLDWMRDPEQGKLYWARQERAHYLAQQEASS